MRLPALVLLGTLALVAALAPLSCSPAPASQNVVRIGYLRIGSDLCYFVGVEEGIFEKHGLTVEGTRFGKSGHVSDALLGDDIDATDIIGSSVVFRDAAKYPSQLKVFLASVAGPEQNIHQLVARKGGSITNISDLQGKKLAVFPGTQMRVYARLFLGKHLPAQAIESVELVPLSPPQQYQAMKENQVDAVLALEPTGTQLVEEGIGQRVAHNVLYESLSKPTGFVTAFGVVSTEWAETNPTGVSALVAAYQEISAFIANNPVRAREILASALNLDPEVAQKCSVYDYQVCPDIDQGPIEHTLKLMTSGGALDQAIETSDLLLSID